MKKNINKLIIFTKSPILGEVKTRLQPDYTPEQSLNIHTALLFKTLELTRKLEGVDIELCCAPDRNTSFFLKCENEYPITLSNQEGENLGERMAFSTSVTLQTYDKVLVIGSDCPDIDEEYIQQGFTALDSSDAVIGPAADGGYVLLGFKQFSPEVFNDILWGEDSVYEETVASFELLDWTWHKLDTKHDVDRSEDLQRYPFLLTNLNKGIL